MGKEVWEPLDTRESDKKYRDRVKAILDGLKDGSFVLDDSTRAELRVFLRDAVWSRLFGNPLQSFYGSAFNWEYTKNGHHAHPGWSPSIALVDQGTYARKLPNVPSFKEELMKDQAKPLMKMGHRPAAD